MELKEFVSDSLVGIIDGIIDAQRRTTESGAVISSDEFDGKGNVETKSHKVYFDIAVSLMEMSDKKGFFSISVLSINAGKQKDTVSSAENVSRIRFDIDVIFPHPVQE
jgi:hypothetical protein